MFGGRAVPTACVGEQQGILIHMHGATGRHEPWTGPVHKSECRCLTHDYNEWWRLRNLRVKATQALVNMRSVGDGDFETMCTTQTLGELHEWPDMALYRERKQQGMRPWWTHSNLHLLQTKQQSNLEQIHMLEAAITVGQSPLQRIPTMCTAGYIVKEKKTQHHAAQHVQIHITLDAIERLSWRED